MCVSMVYAKTSVHLPFGSVNTILYIYFSAIFGVPQQICAECYLAAVQKYEDLGPSSSTSLRHIHFVDINDAMVSAIQATFTTHWGKGLNSAPGSGQAPSSHSPDKENTVQRADTQSAGARSSPSSPMDRPDPRSPAAEEHQAPSSTALPRAQPQAESKGLPVLATSGTGQDMQYQISFTGLDLTLVLRKEEVAKVGTEALVLWQDVQNVLKDELSKAVMKEASQQAKDRITNLKKELVTVGKVETLTSSKYYLVFPSVSLPAMQERDKVQSVVEQVLNKVNLVNKGSVAIPQMPRPRSGNVDISFLHLLVSFV